MIKVINYLLVPKLNLIQYIKHPQQTQKILPNTFHSHPQDARISNALDIIPTILFITLFIPKIK